MNAKEHEILTRVETHVAWLRDFMVNLPKECDKKYARKYVEKFQWLAVGGMITIVVGIAVGIVTIALQLAATGVSAGF